MYLNCFEYIFMYAERKKAQDGLERARLLQIQANGNAGLRNSNT